MDEVPTKSYSMKEVAERLGVTYDHVYRLCKYGRLKSFHVGKAVRITDKAILEFLNRSDDGQE